jgi:hypothetical protein
VPANGSCASGRSWPASSTRSSPGWWTAAWTRGDAVLRDGAGGRLPHHRALPARRPRPPGQAASVPAGLPGRRVRPRAPGRPPRPQTGQRAGHRDGTGEAPRLRDRQAPGGSAGGNRAHRHRRTDADPGLCGTGAVPGAAHHGGHRRLPARRAALRAGDRAIPSRGGRLAPRAAAPGARASSPSGRAAPPPSAPASSQATSMPSCSRRSARSPATATLVEALRRDVEAYLESRPVGARRGTSLYRFANTCSGIGLPSRPPPSWPFP